MTFGAFYRIGLALLLCAGGVGASELHNVNIIGPTDDRESLLTLAPKIGLDNRAVERIRRASGTVLCPNGKQGIKASAQLVESNRVVVTAAHMFYDPDGNDPPKECYFVNHSDPPQASKLIMDGLFRLCTFCGAVNPTH